MFEALTSFDDPAAAEEAHAHYREIKASADKSYNTQSAWIYGNREDRKAQFTVTASTGLNLELAEILLFAPRQATSPGRWLRRRGGSMEWITNRDPDSKRYQNKLLNSTPRFCALSICH